ncbi:MAG: TRAP transporter substrate-binding protein [Rhodospirillales bacterium]
MRTMLALALGAAVAAGPAAAQTTTLKFNSFAPPQELLTSTVFPEFAKNVADASAGTVKIDLFPGGGLGRDPSAQLKLVMDGVADIAFILPSNTPGRFPDNEIIQLPFLVNTSEEGSLLLWRLFAKGMLRGYDDIVVLALSSTPQYRLHTTFPVAKLEDLKGKKIRSGGRVHGELLKALGAAPVGMPTPFVAENISKGVLDGTLLGFEVLKAFRIADVTKHHFVTPLGTLELMVAMNKQSYEKLPADGKAAFQKHLGEAFARRMGTLQDQLADKVEGELKAEAGQAVVMPAKDEEARWRAAFDPVVAEWTKSHAKGAALVAAAQTELTAIRAAR